MKNIKKEKGITLIALVITIIVLLILAGVTISMLSGENGILTRAVEAKEKTEIGQKEETTNLESMDLETYFITNNLKYKCAYGYITGVGVEGLEVTDTVEDLQKALPERYSVSGENITTDTKLYTGLSVTKDSQEVAKVVVYGDCNGDGIIDGFDVARARNVLSSMDIENVILQSIDVNHDGIVNEDDRIIVKRYIVNDGFGVDINQNVYAKRTEDLKIVYDFEYNQNIIDNELPKEFRDSYNIYYNTEKEEHVLKLESNQEVKAIEILNKLGEKYYDDSWVRVKQEDGKYKKISVDDTDAEDIVKNEDYIVIVYNEDIRIEIYIEKDEG